MSAISRAANQLGSVAALASKLELKHQVVWSWVNSRFQAPAKYIIAISNATDGKVSIEELLSDHTQRAERLDLIKS